MKKGLILPALGATAALLFAVIPAQAETADTQKTHERCVTVLAAKAPGEKTSRVLHRSCAVETFEQSARARATGVGPMDSTLLAVFWEDVDFGGDESDVYGDDGTCDHEGYGIADMDDVQDETEGVSSYQLVGNCDVSEKFSDYDFEGRSSGLIFGQRQTWVGADWNDGNIKSFAMHQN